MNLACFFSDEDVDLVASLLDNLRERVSLALAMTVRNLSLAECTSFLEMRLGRLESRAAFDFNG